LAFAVSILRGGDFDIAAMEDDLPGSEVTHGGETGTFRSLRSGPDVTLLPASDLQDEIEQVAALVRRWSDEILEKGGDPSTIGVLTRFKRPATPWCAPSTTAACASSPWTATPA